MSAEAPFLSRRFRVGAYTCTMTVPRPRPGSVISLATEWAPSAPSRLSSKELRQYRNGRDAALAEVSRALGAPVAVMEV